ncbi:MAG: methionyl-tRNA formyltransferase [Saprospiraceae bacterium]
MRIIFMGTPEFAVVSLKAILNSSHRVVAVVTAPDALGGRGRKELIQSDVKKFALTQELPILQPEKLRDKKFLEKLKSFHADLQVVVAFRMLPEIVWNMPSMGTLNVHGSLLPKYRGAAPIHWAVINGEKETGVTIFKLKHEIDTGDVILRAHLPIGENETTGDVYSRLMFLGAETLIKALDKMDAGNVIYEKQSDALASPAPKLFHIDCKINFLESSSKIHNFVRGLHPKPTAWMIWHDQKYFIHRTRKVEDISITPISPNKLISFGKKLYVGTIDGPLEILEIQVEGKRKMTGEEFGRGLR